MKFDFDASDIRVQIHSIIGDVENALMKLRHSKEKGDKALLVNAGEALAEATNRISALVYPPAYKPGGCSPSQGVV